LNQYNKKDAWGHLRNWPDSTCCGLKESFSIVKTAPLLGPKELLPLIQPSRHSEATAAMVQRGLTTAQAGSKPLCYPHHAVFSGASDARPGSIGYNVYPAGFWCCFGPFFLSLPHSSLLEWEHSFCATVSWEYVTCFWFCRDSQLSFTWVSEEILNLDFWKVYGYSWGGIE
jgi:uncharacterized protein (DUF779 family)